MQPAIFYLIPAILTLWVGIGIFVVKKEVRLPAPPVRIRKSYRRFMNIR